MGTVDVTVKSPYGTTVLSAAFTYGVPVPANLGQVAGFLTHSAESYRFFIQTAYQNYLGRGPDNAGIAYWVGRMQRGFTDEALEASFIGSPEYLAASYRATRSRHLSGS